MQYYKKLLNDLKQGQLAPVYLFYGPETYLKGQMLSQFKKVLLPQDTGLNLEVVDGEKTELATLVNSANTLPFMAERRLVLVKNPPWFSSAHSGKKRKTGSAATKQSEPPGMKLMLDYLTNPALTTCLIFDAGATVDKRRKIFKIIEKAGQIVDFQKLKPSELGHWLDSQARSCGKKLDRTAREILSTATTTGLSGLVQEWQKLITYLGEQQTISADDVKKIVHRSVEYRIFDVMDAIGDCRYEMALNGIKELLTNKEPPPVILAMVVRQFRLMLQVNELVGRGLSTAGIAKQINEKPYPVKNALRTGRNFSRSQLITVLTQLAQLDVDIKTGRQEFYPGLEYLLLSIAVKKFEVRG
ncbi:MAG: DNA polymerase III subunit delta [Desulfotomaculum sp.]|nr:DNA polymerase III subunit delta [Desulfotomaculum sp.]